MSELPIACSLPGRELTDRAAELLPGLARLATSSVPIDRGYRFEFVASSECLHAVVAVIDAERACCRFMHFQLTVEPDAGPIRLDVTGPPGTREFISGLVESP
jgi:hypothetical protein